MSQAGLNCHAKEGRQADGFIKGAHMSTENETLSKFTKLQSVSLKPGGQLSEKQVQDQIADDPTILGLARELEVLGRERRQPKAGRLDLLLGDPNTSKRYVVEIQLGATDESHIIRTIEYWDLERRRNPQYKHAAVIVAEDITTRFYNVIQLFNGAIPLIALKMTVYRIRDQYALTFVKVLDEIMRGSDDDEPIPQPVDRLFWETDRGTKETLSLTDDLFAVVKEVESSATLKYNKYNIGLEVGGNTFNFVKFRPLKGCVRMEIKLPQDLDTDKNLDSAGVEYESQDQQYIVRIREDMDDSQRNALKQVFVKARDMFKK